MSIRISHVLQYSCLLWTQERRGYLCEFFSNYLASRDRDSEQSWSHSRALRMHAPVLGASFFPTEYRGRGPKPGDPIRDPSTLTPEHDFKSPKASECIDITRPKLPLRFIRKSSPTPQPPTSYPPIPKHNSLRYFFHSANPFFIFTLIFLP